MNSLVKTTKDSDFYEYKREIIIVGVAARNEEKTIISNLKSIIESIKFTKRKNINLVVCLNGCTDSTPELVIKFKENNPNNDINIIYSEEGLINSQRTIVEKFPANIYVFSDADDVINKESIELLIRALEKSNIAAAYAKTIPLMGTGKNTLCNKIAYLYDTQKILKRRYHLHGRLFAIKDWFIPKEEDILKRLQLLSNTDRKFILYGLRNSPLLVDDIFLSSYILDKYGINSIEQIDGAYCYSWPASRFSDWYKVYRRRNIEMEKMYRWFPEFNYLKPYLNRKTDYKKWLSESAQNKVLWICFLFMKLVFYIRLKIELISVLLFSNKPTPQWQSPTSTKININ